MKKKFIEINNYTVTFLSDRLIDFLALENGQISQIDKSFRKKNCRFYQKMLKFETLKC